MLSCQQPGSSFGNGILEGTRSHVQPQPHKHMTCMQHCHCSLTQTTEVQLIKCEDRLKFQTAPNKSLRLPSGGRLLYLDDIAESTICHDVSLLHLLPLISQAQ